MPAVPVPALPDQSDPNLAELRRTTPSHAKPLHIDFRCTESLLAKSVTAGLACCASQNHTLPNITLPDLA